MKLRFGNDENKHVQITMSRPRRQKTCEGCKALIDGSPGEDYSCYLGYALNRDGIPQEKCPKPRSNTRMVELHLAGKQAWKQNMS